MKKICLVLIFVVAGCGSVDLEKVGSNAGKQRDECPVVCHCPPGYPHDDPACTTLWGEPGAIAAHLRHGDVCGRCPVDAIDPVELDPVKPGRPLRWHEQ